MLIFIKIIGYIFASYGISEMVIFGRGPWAIFEKWREFSFRISEGFGELFQCMLCFPTWVGLFFSLIDVILLPTFAFTPFSIIFSGIKLTFWIGFLNIILDMLFTSGICWCLYSIEEYLETHKIIVYKDGKKNTYSSEEDLNNGKQLLD